MSSFGNSYKNQFLSRADTYKISVTECECHPSHFGYFYELAQLCGDSVYREWFMGEKMSVLSDLSQLQIQVIKNLLEQAEQGQSG